MKYYYPEVFAAALLNSQPMGFYAPAQLVRDAREHKVEVRPPDMNASDWDCTLEPGRNNRCALRLGLRQIAGLSEEDVKLMVRRRTEPYRDPADLWRRSGLSKRQIIALARADAFASLGLSRRDVLWAVRGFSDAQLPLLDSPTKMRDLEPAVSLPALTLGEQVVDDYGSISMSLRSHPLALLRPRLCERGVAPTEVLKTARNDDFFTLAGLVLVRQRPGTASGVVFVTIEDEQGIANLVVWPRVFDAHRRIVMGSRLLAVRGRVQREGLVIHLVAEQLWDWSAELDSIADIDATSTWPAAAATRSAPIRATAARPLACPCPKPTPPAIAQAKAHRPSQVMTAAASRSTGPGSRSLHMISIETVLSCDRELILPPSRLGESTDAVVAGHERTAEADGTGNEQPVGRIAMLQVVQAIGTRRSRMVKRHRFQPRTIEKPFHPFNHRHVELDETLVHEHRDLPHADRAEKYSAARFPGRVYRSASRLAQPFVTAVQPQHDMRIEQKVGHRRISRPLSASIFSSSTGRVRSTPRRTFTEPGWLPNRDCVRAFSARRRRTAVATSSVLFPPVISAAAFSMSATTSGRLIVTTLAMSASYNDTINDLMIGALKSRIYLQNGWPSAGDFHRP